MQIAGTGHVECVERMMNPFPLRPLLDHVDGPEKGQSL